MDTILSPLSIMGAVLIKAPYFALIPTALFSWLYLKTRGKQSHRAAWLWGLYTVYEYAINLGILCDGECNIRIDLLLIYPVLLLITLIAVISAVRHFRAIKTPNKS